MVVNLDFSFSLTTRLLAIISSSGHQYGSLERYQPPGRYYHPTGDPIGDRIKCDK